MKLVLSGSIEDNCPTVKATINEDKNLVFNKKGGLALTIDTGFSAGIALPKTVLSKLNIRFVGYENYTLADGKSIELEEYYGDVRVGNNKVEAVFIEGDYLIGMEFMTSIADVMTVDFKKEKVALLK